MDRRTFNKLAGMAAIGSVAEPPQLAEGPKRDATAGSAPSASEVILEDSEFLVAFDSTSGSLVRFESKTTPWTIQRRPELGASFRLLAPLPERRDNFVLGGKQRAAEVTKLSNQTVRLRWENLVSEHGGVLPMALTAEVTLSAGALRFQATLENRSDLVVETIDYPYFGDLNPPSKSESLAVRTMWYGNLGSEEVYPNFGNGTGYWGVDVPTKTIGSHHSLFCLLQGQHAGLYVEFSDPTQPYYMEYTFEQHPGVLNKGRVPKTDTISGWPVHLEFRTCHFVFAHGHSVKKLTPL